MVDLVVNVKQTGLNELVNSSAQVNENLKQAAASAARISTPVRAASAPSGMGETKTARSIGAGAGTGSSASDFAAQAQGLGGLVHVYATFAANIYATSAAFNALKDAMNVAHLTQGLDQLAASSGKNLGSLATQLNKVTDGALNMQQSMTAVATSSSLGMTSDQILKMGEVAKKASQAMGYDMAAAMERLTKGINLGRPQLLDELGIIINLNTVHQDYARSIGKTATSLTDYEKKQSVANAVLQQGLDKFGVIDIPTNPFNKLEASMTNVANSALNLVNVFLGPIAKALAESPTGLATAMGGVAILLINKAIPALSNWRQGLQKAAEESAATAKRIHDNFEAFDIQRKLNIGSDLAKSSNQAANEAIAGVQTALGKALTDKSKLLKSAMSGTYDAAAEASKIASEAKRSETYLLKLQEAKKLIDETDTVHMAAMDKDITRQQEKIGYLKQAVLLAKLAGDEQLKAKNILDAAETKAAMAPRVGSEAWQRQQIAQQSAAKARSGQIMANVGYSTENMGVVSAFKALHSDIQTGTKVYDEAGNVVKVLNDKMSLLGQGAAYAGGTIRILGSAASTAISAFMPWVLIIGTLVSAFEILDSWLSKAKEQQSAFTDSTVASTSAVKVAIDSVTFLGTKSKNIFSIESFTAMSNALSGINDSLGQQLKAFDDLTIKQTNWEYGWDKFWGLFNKSNMNDITKSIGKDIPAALDTMLLSGNYDKAKAKFAEILNIDPTSAEGVTKALNSMTGPERTAAIRKIKSAFTELADEENKTSFALKNFKDSLGETSKEADALIAKIQLTGEAKLGESLQKDAINLGLAFQNPIKGMESIVELANNMKVNGLLPKDTVDQLFKAKFQADELSKSLADAVKARQKAQDAVSSAKASGKYTTTSSTDTGIDGIMTVTEKVTSALGMRLDQAVAASDKAVKDTQDKIAAFTNSQTKIITAVYQAGADLIASGLKNAVAQANITIARGSLDVRAAAGLDTVKASLDLRLKELDLQKVTISTAFNQANATAKNTEQMELLTAEFALSRAQQEQLKSNNTEADARRILDTITNAQKTINNIVLARIARVPGNATPPMTAEQSSQVKLINQPFEVNAAGLKSATIALDATKANEIAKAGIALITEQTKHKNEYVDQLIAENNAVIDSINLAEKYSNGYSQTLADEKTDAQLKQEALNYAKAIIPLAEELQRLSKFSPADTEANTKRANTFEAMALAAEKLSKAQQNIKLGSSDTTFLENQKKQQANYTLAKSLLQDFVTVEQARLSLQDQELANAQALNKIDAISYINAKAANDLEKQRLSYLVSSYDAQIALTTAQDQQKREQERADAAKAAYDARPDQARGMAAPDFSAALDTANKAVITAQTRVNTLSQVNDLTNKGITGTQAQNLELEKQKQHLADINANTTALTTVFGDLGKAIGDAAASMDTFARNSADRLAQEAKAKPDELAALKSKNAKAELSDIATVAATYKKMYGEQTVAYKAAAAIEKGASLERLSLAAKEAGLNEEGIKQAMASAGQWIEKVKDGTLVQGIQDVINQGAGDPYTAIPRMIAMASFVSSLTGQNVSGPPPVDQGTLAGTGQQVGADGQTIGTRQGGVLGDPKATAKSITDAIDGLSKVFFNTLGSSSSNLVGYLKGIQDNTYNTAKALGAAGVMGGSNPFGAAIGESKAFGGGALGSALSSIFGGDTSTAVTGAGITGTGTAGQFATGAQGFQGYTNVHEETSGGLFGGGSSRDYTQYAQLDKSIQKGLQGIFQNFNSALLETAGSLGQSKEAIQKILDTTTLSLKVSNVGLTGTEFAQKLSAEVSVQLNAIAEQAYPFLSLYTKVGEESFQVAARLIKDGETVTYGLSMVSKSLNTLDVSAAEAVASQQKVIDNFGGTADAFATAIEAYYNALFSDSEKAAFGLSSTQKQLSDLGLTGVTTNKQLKELIATVDPTTKLYADLVKLAPAFADANAAAQKLTDSVNDQEASIYSLVGNPSKALEISRQKEIAALDDVLKPRQIYINALTDEVALRDKLKTAYTTSNNALTNSIKTLNDYKTALTAGASSTLTPAEKYAQAKSIFMQTAAAAQAAITTSSTAADIATRDAALAKIQSTGDALLGASKEVNASGAQYAADFSTVTDTVGKTADILSGQQTDQQKQLGFLDTIATATETTAQLLDDYLKAQAATAVAQANATTAGSTAATMPIPGHAKGGIANGWSLVGEQGPELVNFSNPGRVYSNQASNELFNNKELIAEIKALRDEVTQLRADQKEQTGHIIATNYDANTRNAAAITAGTEDAAKQQDWKTRSQVKVA